MSFSAEKLAKNPKNIVYDVKFGEVREPTKARDARTVLSKISSLLESLPNDLDDKEVVKTLNREDDVREFGESHPNLFSLASNRDLMRDEKKRNAIISMLEVREKVERGEMDQNEANALVTKMVVSCLQGDASLLS
jgi:hypothetical protein